MFARQHVFQRIILNVFGIIARFWLSVFITLYDISYTYHVLLRVSEWVTTHTAKAWWMSALH
jgi:hypothetical protein